MNNYNINTYGDVVNDILASANIVDVISHYVKLQRKGSSYFGLCPFHHDTHPSLAVAPKKNIWKCFVCGEGGNVFNFVAKYEKISYAEAIKKVAELINYDQAKLNQFINKDSHFDHWNPLQERLILANKRLNDIYMGQLYKKENVKALTFLKNRKIDDETIKFFQLGYAPNDLDSIHDWLTNKDNYLGDLPPEQKFNDDELIKANIVNENYHPTLINRITFPIINMNGSIVAFSGRDIGINSSVKYLHSQNTIVFDKSQILWNYQNAATANSDKIILVEGFFDCISYHLAGFTNTVACMGTALTKNHLNLLHKLKKLNTVIVAFDNDSAGLESNLKNGKFLLENGFNVSVANYLGLTEKDADDIRNKYGEDKLKELINQRIDYISFYIQNKLSKPLPTDEQTVVVNELIDFIVHYDTLINRTKHLKLIAQLTNLDLTDLQAATDLQKMSAYRKFCSSNYNGWMSTRQVTLSSNSSTSKITLTENKADKNERNIQILLGKIKHVLTALRKEYENLILYILTAPNQIDKVNPTIKYNFQPLKTEKLIENNNQDCLMIFKIVTVLFGKNPQISSVDLINELCNYLKQGSGQNNDLQLIYQLANKELNQLTSKKEFNKVSTIPVKKIEQKVDDTLKQISILNQDFDNFKNRIDNLNRKK